MISYRKFALAAGMLAACCPTPTPAPTAPVLTAVATTSSPPSATLAATPARVAFPPHYASLFDEGHLFNYKVAYMHSRFEDGKTDTKREAFDMDCRIVDVVHQPRVSFSRMTCSHPLGVPYVQTLGVSYAATTAGLWVSNSTERAPDADSLDKEAMLIAATPEPVNLSQEGDEGSESYEVKADGDSWCVSHVTVYGDEASREACFGPAGIVTTTWTFGGGHVEEYRATLVQ